MSKSISRKHQIIPLANNFFVSYSFRRLALKFHPLRNPTNLATNTAKFNEICEAFDVLSEPERKALFDKYGEYGFKEGVPSKTGSKYSIFNIINYSMLFRTCWRLLFQGKFL